jgi:aromatic ring-opening dioxygenase catalytic subunit (LigB family)
MMEMPVLFVSHGAPTLPLEPGETGVAWQKLGAQLPKPIAILVISAHWETHIPTISRAVEPETIHDFSGFPEALYQLRYPAPGAPNMAQAAATALQQAGIAVQLDDARGLDALRAYRTLAPHAAQNHPTEEHLLPLFVALGAATHVASAQHLNQVMTFGLLAMDAWLLDNN